MIVSFDICSWQAGDSREVMVQFRSSYEGLRNRRADGVNSSPKAGRLQSQGKPGFSSSPKARKDYYVSTRPSGKRGSLLLSFFVVYRSSTD